MTRRLSPPRTGGCGFEGAEETAAAFSREPPLLTLTDLQTATQPADWAEVLTGGTGELLATTALPAFLSRQRWYADKEAVATSVTFADRVRLGSAAGDCVLAIIDACRPGAAPQRYCLPLAVTWKTDDDDPLPRLRPQVVARVRRGADVGVLFDATLSADLPRLILDALREGRVIASSAGHRLVCRPTAAFDACRDWMARHCRKLGGEQSNTSLLIDDRVIIKLYRRLQPGIHPEIEIGRFLTDTARFPNTPRLLGSIELEDDDGAVTAVVLVQEFIRNQGDGWTRTLDHLDRVLNTLGSERSATGATVDEASLHADYLMLVDVLARRVGELHRTFAIDVGDPSFAPEAPTAKDIETWNEETRDLTVRARDVLIRAIRSKALDKGTRRAGERVLDAWQTVETRSAVSPEALSATVKTRCHGDLHLGQVVVAGSDVYILDFEGEPLHSLERRREKCSPLRDVAGMVRSFDYAGNAAVIRRRVAAGEAMAAEQAIARWQRQTTERFLAAYRQAVAGCRSVPQADGDFAAALSAFVLSKALYELCYEAANRPDWLAIPLVGVSRLLDDGFGFR